MYLIPREADALCKKIHHGKDLKSGLENKKHPSFPAPRFPDFAGEEPCQQDYLVPDFGGSWWREGKYPESASKGVVDVCSYRAGKTIILELHFNNIPSQKDSQTLNRLAANQQSTQKVAQTLTDNGQTVFNPAWQLSSYLGVILFLTAKIHKLQSQHIAKVSDWMITWAPIMELLFCVC